MVDFDLRPGGALPVAHDRSDGEPRRRGELPDVIIDGEVVEADPPHRLVHTFRMLMDPGMAQEPSTRITYEIKELRRICSLTLTHELEGAPNLASLVPGDRRSTAPVAARLGAQRAQDPARDRLGVRRVTAGGEPP